MQNILGDVKTYNKHDVAMQFFNLALAEYIKTSNMFAVIHLASAAEEIFGNIVSINSGQNALSRTQKLFKSMYKIIGKNTPSNNEINRYVLQTKNSIKHVNGEADLAICLDVNKEAKEVIRRAIENFNLIPSLQQSQELLAYYQHEKNITSHCS